MSTFHRCLAVTVLYAVRRPGGVAYELKSINKLVSNIFLLFVSFHERLQMKLVIAFAFPV